MQHDCLGQHVGGDARPRTGFDFAESVPCHENVDGIFTEKRRHGGQCPRKKIVIRIDEPVDLPGRARKAAVQSIGRPVVALEDPDNAIPIGLDELAAAVGAAGIDHDVLELAPFLTQDRIDTGTQIFVLVKGDRHDRDLQLALRETRR